MNRPRKKDYPSTIPVPAAFLACATGSVVVLAALLWFIPAAFADDFGLINPAEKDFGEFQSESSDMGQFAKKTPLLNDRALPIPPKTGKKTKTIRQVSTSENDPFPQVTQPTVPQTQPFDWGTTVPMTAGNPLADQSNVVPYSTMSGMYPTGMEMTYFPQYVQGSMVNGENLSMNPYANMYPQYGNVADPYAMGYQLGNQADYQAMPDYSSLYYAMMMQQEMIRQQTEESQKKKNKKDDAEEAKKQADAAWTLNNLVPVRVTSPLGETMYACSKTMSPFSTPPGPDKGVGMPLVSKSWLDHPYYAGGSVGTIAGSELVSKMIKQKQGGTGGLIFGYNFNDYWGFESRLHFASIDIYDTAYAKQLIQDLNPDWNIVSTSRTNALTIIDVSALYFPLGNAKWRPYFKYGLGFGQQKFIDSFGYTHSKGIGTMPLGMGVRYWWNERLAIQADLTDNVIFSSGIAKTQNNFGLTVGLSYAFGTGKTNHPVHYWPATPSMGSKW